VKWNSDVIFTLVHKLRTLLNWW